MCFEVRVAGQVPRSMGLVNIVWVPGLDDYCSLAYAGRANTGFRFVQRLASDGCLENELALTGDDHERIVIGQRSCALYSGMYLTEPIDGRLWAPTRRRLVWYEDELRLELEAVLDGRTTTEGLVAIAEKTRPLAASDLATRRAATRRRKDQCG
jgi:hypothetical protein